VNVIVRYNNEDGNFSPAQVTDTAFGTFTVSSGGFGPGIVTNSDYAVNSAQTTFRPGEAVIVWGTGLGASLNADNVPPQAGDLPVDVEIWVGGVAVSRKLYSGRSPEFPGLDQVVFEIPGAAPTGCYVPVVLRTAKRVVSNSSTIAIAANGAACSDPASPFSAMRAGGRTGIVLLNRLHNLSIVPGMPGFDFSADMVSAIFQDEPTGIFHFNRLYSLPPPGSCITSTAVGSTLNATLLANLAISGSVLDAGDAISVLGPLSSATAGPLPAARKFYGAMLANDYSFGAVKALFFGSGSHRVSGPGGANVGAFQVDLTPPTALAWLNRASVTALHRGASFDFTWSGGDPQGLVLILGFARAKRTASTASFACVQRSSQGRTTVPDWVTAHFPDPAPGSTDAVVGVLALPASAAHFTATGLETGLGLFLSGEIRAVELH
jgi:hypothetical protein